MSLNKYLTLSCCLLLSCYFLQTVEAQYKITVKIDGYENDTCMLGYTIGSTTYVQQKVFEKNSKGEFIFEGEKTLLGGFYSVFTKPKNQHFNFIISNDEEQKDFRMKTKIVSDATVDLSANLKFITKSPDNQVFETWKEFLVDLRKKSEVLNKDVAAAKEKKDSTQVNKLNKELANLNKEVLTYQEELIEKYPTYFSASLLKASIQPPVPKGYSRSRGFYYFREHYWDNFNWNDARLIRTSVFKKKLTYYTDKLTVQVPDSVKKAVSYILDNVLKGGNKDMFQYASGELLNKYAKTKLICMDAVYVFLGEKYYCSGKVDWVDSAQLAKICANVATLKPLQCGLYAPNIRLKKMDGTPINLYDIKAEFTALYFWDPDCGNCSKTTDKLLPIYKKWKSKGFEVFGVCSKAWKDIDKCKAKIKDKEISWLNTSDEPYPLAVAKKRYDIKVNPYLVLLDKDKKILWKRLDPQQVDDILTRAMGDPNEGKAVDKAVEEEFKKKEKENEEKK